MKANGKNLKMFKYETHHYMDMKPETHFRTIESAELMKEFIEHMRTNWCSGTVSNAHEVTPEEFFRARQSSYWRGYEDMLDKAALDCSQEWLNVYSAMINNL